jgi:hypothetical protein
MKSRYGICLVFLMILCAACNKQEHTTVTPSTDTAGKPVQIKDTVSIRTNPVLQVYTGILSDSFWEILPTTDIENPVGTHYTDSFRITFLVNNTVRIFADGIPLTNPSVLASIDTIFPYNATGIYNAYNYSLQISGKTLTVSWNNGTSDYGGFGDLSAEDTGQFMGTLQ